jgi:hypothetical protein
VNGATTKSPLLEVRHGGADVGDHADELVPDRPERVRRLAAVVPEVRAADAAEDDADDASVGASMTGSGRSPTTMSRGPLKMAARMSLLVSVAVS